MDTRPLRNVTIGLASCGIGIQFGSLVMLESVACFVYMFQGFPSKRRPVTPDSRMGFCVSATIGRSPMSKVEKVNGFRAEINLKIGRWELLPSMSIRFFNLYYVMLQSFTQSVGCFFRVYLTDIFLYTIIRACVGSSDGSDQKNWGKSWGTGAGLKLMEVEVAYAMAWCHLEVSRKGCIRFNVSIQCAT